MQELNEPELDCLKTIANNQSSVNTTCAEHTIHRLESLGLIEQAPRIWLPLEMMRMTYRLTPAGQAVLRQR